MRQKILAAVLLLAAVLVTAPCFAAIVAINPVGGDGPGTSLQEQLIAIGATTNVNTDQLASNNFWNLGPSGGSVNTFVIALAGNKGSNEFGIYRGSTFIPVFAGVPAFPSAIVNILADGKVFVNGAYINTFAGGTTFGYYLNGPGGQFFSDESKNNDGIEHMVAFQGNGTDMVTIAPFGKGVWSPNEYILAWEDVYGGDFDYQDLVVMVESVQPLQSVPEPGTLLLLGSGLVGLAGLRKKIS